MAATHSQRVRRVAQKLADRQAARTEKPLTLRRVPVSAKPRIKRLIAYDLETTPIEVGTPLPLYITAYGDASFFVSAPVKSIPHLRELIVERFLLDELKGCRFIAWNGNRFDVYFIAAALLHDPEYVIKPYLTNTNNLRGIRVVRRIDRCDWEFLDGMAMTGIQKPLKKFLEVFAPDFAKLDAPDWENGEGFDSSKPEHRRYAERDSEGLYHAICKAQGIVMEHFGLPLQPTIGNLGIKAFRANMPETTRVVGASPDVTRIIKEHVMRGGFCHCVRRYEGPVWKYDLNQAYAAAMRDANLPAGNYSRIKRFPDVPVPGIYNIEAVAPDDNLVPMYFRDANGKAKYEHRFVAGWLCDMEVRQLIAEGWKIKILDGYWWHDSFSMKGYVDKLENLRVNAPGGPKSAQGEMVKAIGNNSYGKTVETLTGLDLVMALVRPEGYSHFQHPDERLQHLWYAIGEAKSRDYHQPAIGAFITAHVRMQVRRAALLAPREWIYADTDCVVFTKSVDLPISERAYGFWKQETDGEHFRFIAKKVYANLDASEKHAKGLNVKRLKAEDFEKWINGDAPIQTQVQRQNFIKAMSGAEMFISRTRRGEKKV